MKREDNAHQRSSENGTESASFLFDAAAGTGPGMFFHCDETMVSVGWWKAASSFPGFAALIFITNRAKKKANTFLKKTRPRHSNNSCRTKLK